MMKKLAIVTTHPIQYNAPWFQLLAKRGRIGIKVFYTWSQVQQSEKFDPGFKQSVEWDIPLLENYDNVFVENLSKNPGSKSYRGIDNPTLIEEISAWKPDAILVFGWKFKSHLNVLRYFQGKIPLWFRGDSTNCDEISGWKSTVRSLVLKRVFKYIDYALFVGTLNRHYYVKAGLADRQLVHAPHAIDHERFSATALREKEGVRQLRKELQIPEEAIVFLFAGKWEAKKDPLILIDAFLSSASLRGCFLLLAGSGELESVVKKRVEKSRNILLLPFQNQSRMPLLYGLADVFVLPSRGPGETWGLAVNEAMACSKPVLVSDKCGCAVDLVKVGSNGYIFESGDQEALQEKLELLANLGKEGLAEMGKESERIIQYWSFENIVEAVEGLMERI